MTVRGLLDAVLLRDHVLERELVIAPVVLAVAPGEEDRRDDQGDADDGEDRPVFPRIRRVGALFHLRSSPAAPATAATASRSASRGLAGTSRRPSGEDREDESRGRPRSASGGSSETRRRPPPAGLRSSHGQTVSSRMSAPGSSTPPRNAPLTVNDPIRNVVSVTISWSQRKYQGAFAGLGVTSALAGSSSGDRRKTERMLTIAIVPAPRSRPGERDPEPS